MKSKYPFLSIIIATYDSANTLPMVLESIKKQTYPVEKIEILIIDGGSTDKTKSIALSYKCRIINNPKTLCVWAKFIGYKSAKGKYIMFLDSDEVIEQYDSIQRKIKAFLDNPQVHAVTGSGYKTPRNYSFFNQYVNEFGDPFSFFIYRLSKDTQFFINTLLQRYSVVSSNKDFLILDFSHSNTLPIFELVAMGSIIDLCYVNKHVPEVFENPGLFYNIFNLLILKNSHVAIVKKDPLIHYSVNSIQKYLPKINSRVVSNIFAPSKEGFIGRDEFSKGFMKYKRYLFIPYAYSIIFPFFDAVFLCFTRRTLGYLFHVPLCLFTASLIIYYTGLKFIGVQPSIKSYG